METLFTKEYVETILKPFENKKIRMRTLNEEKTFSIPFCLETDMEATFQMELNNMGIKFLLKDNFYIKKDLKEDLKNAILSTGLYLFSLDDLLKQKSEEDCVVFSKIVKYLEENFKPQIAFTYYNMITSLKVEENKFVLNGIEFIIYK